MKDLIVFLEKRKHDRQNNSALLFGQIINFLGTLQNEWADVQEFSSFDTYLAPFVRNDELSYDLVKQCIQVNS